MGLILLGTEISSGIISTPFRQSVREKRNEGEFQDITQSDKESNRIRHYDDQVATSDELSYDWQAPPDLGFADVGGLDDVKSDIHRRVITPLRTENDAYERFRVTPPTGILLYGPPGTGKSYLARAIAGELGSPFVELSQADLTSMWINESPRMIRRLFEEAELIGSSVIFIDEIDGLVATRDASGHREDSKLISELLARLGEEGTNYLIIAATNRPDQLDAAILRPGRFDEQFEIGIPEAHDREEIFKVQLRQRNPSITDSEFRILGKRSEGLTAADIASVVERAALRAAERDAPHISFDDLSMSLAEGS
jgi:SpoVK/Ycf46/Vps4 family AAA+-type ATPase